MHAKTIDRFTQTERTWEDSMSESRYKELLFWGQFDRKEFAMSFCTAWFRNIGKYEHFSYRARIAEVGENNAFTEGIDMIKKLQPAYVVVWQGNNLNAPRSALIRKACNEAGAKFVFISLDDPFWLENQTSQPYKNAHIIVTCCMEARVTYKARCENNPTIIFAPPACSIDYHIGLSRPSIKNSGVFFFFTNPYIQDIYQKYGAFNRFEIMRRLIAEDTPIGFASVPNNNHPTCFSDEEWSKVDWRGLIEYHKFHMCDNWGLHFNSNVVGRDYVYFNQRVFEILGIGGVQLIDAGGKCRDFYYSFIDSSEKMPFIFYQSVDECIEKAKAFLEAPEEEKEKRYQGARELRWKWTFDHMVRRIVHGLKERTVFDDFEGI
jgi:hypothetical protein